MPFVGDFFLFLHNASDIHPVKIRFKDHEIMLRTQENSYTWRERIYLSPTILQRKWLDYSYRDRFIPSVKYDNVLPLEMDYPFLRELGEEETIRIRSTDKFYRNVRITICNTKGEKVFYKEFKGLSPGSEETFSFSTEVPGVYTIRISTAEQTFRKASLLYYRNRMVISRDDRLSEAYRSFYSILQKKGGNVRLFCTACKSACFPAAPFSTQSFMHKNYIPVKEYLDIEHVGMGHISQYIMGMDHPLIFKRGLIHLLNMLRLASIEDEITIVTNLFKDDPPFAYFITDRLFLFNMIPLMDSRELQNILNRVDDALLASALVGQSGELMAKVLNNISRGRSVAVRQEMQLKPKGYTGASARRDMHRLIRSFFEERYGRNLKIPSGTKLRYRAEDLITCFSEGHSDEIFNHNGNFVFHTGTDIYEVQPRIPYSHSRNGSHIVCLNYDVETFLTDIFAVNGVSESTVYLMNNFGISFALIHIYNWNDSLEDIERLENVGRSTIVPILVRSSATILTIGAIDARGRISEQVIRINKKG